MERRGHLGAHRTIHPRQITGKEHGLQPYYAQISADGVDTVTIHGSGEPSGLVFAKDGIVGWDSTPAVKVEATARTQGDGGFDIPSGAILYASRTVSISVRALADDRAGVQALTDMVRRFAHRLVRLRVVDADRDTYCEGGYLTWEQSSTWRPALVENSTITIVFERPERLSTQEQSVQLICDQLDLGRGGLSYNPTGLSTRWEGEPNNSVSILTTDTLEGTKGLRYPLTYRVFDDEADSSTGMIRNDGTSRAYPVFEVCGDLPDGVDLVFPGTGLQLTCAHPVSIGTPLILDSRTRTASVQGRDVSDTLINRGFPTIQPQSSLALRVRTLGDGWVNVTSHDTYI